MSPGRIRQTANHSDISSSKERAWLINSLNTPSPSPSPPSNSQPLPFPIKCQHCIDCSFPSLVKMLSSSVLHFCRHICPPVRQKLTSQRCLHLATRNAFPTATSSPRAHVSPRRPSGTASRFLTASRCSFSTAPPPDGSDAAPAPPSEPMKIVKFDDLSEEEQKRFQVIQFELEVLRQSGESIPSKLSEREWRKVLAQDSRAQRLKYYRFLFINEMSDENLKQKKAAASLIRQAKHEKIKQELAEEPGVMKYGLNFNTIYPFIRETDMLKAHNVRLAQARQLGQPLVFDLDYDEWMSVREQTNVATQIRDSYAYNKECRDPFWLQLCNCKMQNETMQAIKRILPNLYDPSCLIEVSQKSYRDIFPRSQLVYLSYNAEATLDHFNHEDIYIIGGLVDKTNPKPLSMAKAKREGLRMAKLPLDVFLRWAVGGKNLTLNQMTGIMCDMKLHGDWEKAFLKHIPKRKYLQPEDLDATSDRPYHKERAPYGQRMASPRRQEGARQRGVLETLLSQ